MKRSILLPAIFLLILLIQSAFAQSLPENKIIEGGICNGNATYLPKPELPQSVINANGKGIFGMANVQVLIDEKGNVEKAQAVTGHPLVRPYAEKAALQAKFRIISDLPPSKMNCILAYNFASYDPRKSEEVTLQINIGILNEKASVLQMPYYPTADAEVSGTVNVETKIDLQKGEVISAKAISGHPLLRIQAEKAALLTKFPPTLMEFSGVFGKGFLIYKIEDFNGKTIENKNPKRLFSPIEKGVVNDRAKSLPKPKFPDGGKNAVGLVKVQILIDIDGKVALAEAISGHPLLKPFAETAARETKFAPTLINTSEPFYVKASLLYKFNSDYTVETDFSDKDLVLGSPLELPKPPLVNCNCHYGTKTPQVFVQIEIDENGNVTFAKGISGHIALQQASENAARSSTFSQTKFKGVPVKAKAILLYEFNLDDKPQKVELKSIEVVEK